MTTMITLNVRRVQIVTGSQTGPDHVCLITDQPTPTPGLTSEPLSVDFNAPPGDGERYVREVLLIPSELVEVIGRPAVDYQFGRNRRER